MKGPLFRARGAYVTLICGEFSHTAATVVVSKKVCPKAHDRNTLKRRLRAILQTSDLDFPLACIVRAERSASSATYENLSADLSRLLADALNRVAKSAYNQTHARGV